MTTFAVHYTYGIDSAQGRRDHRDEHVQFLIAMQERDELLLCGAYSDELHPGALLVVAASSADDARRTIQEDPYNKLGFIDEIAVREWVGRLGSRTSALQSVEIA